MLILFLNWVGCFLAAPLYTQSHFRDLHALETEQIFIDNTLIARGERDRVIFNYLENLKKEIAEIELKHHALHLVPSLKTQDLEVEFILNSKMTAGKLWAETHWVSAKYFQNRPPRIPLEVRPCAVCGLAIDLRLPSQIRYGVSLRHLFSELELRQPRGKWEYQLLYE